MAAVKSHIDQHSIGDFKSLNELIAFQNNYEVSCQLVVQNSGVEIEKEKATILTTNRQLDDAINGTQESVRIELLSEIESLNARLRNYISLSQPNPWQKLVGYFKIELLKRKIRNHELNLPSKVFNSVSHLVETRKQNEDRYNYILSSFNDAVFEKCSAKLHELNRKKNLIEEVQSSIYGAIGEMKVLRELQKLSDEFVLINDFSISFNPPIYNHSENEYIKSIQVDHLLIGRSGVFIIETKNWSQESLDNLSLYSPVSQIRRASFALFKLLNSEMTGLDLGNHHWGRKRIALKSVIVMINRKPDEEFQYVKVLTLNQLLKYIEYFPPTLTRREAEDVSDHLLGLAGYPTAL